MSLFSLVTLIFGTCHFSYLDMWALCSSPNIFFSIGNIIKFFSLFLIMRTWLRMGQNGETKLM